MCSTCPRFHTPSGHTDPKTVYSVQEVPGLLPSCDPGDGRVVRPPSHRSHPALVCGSKTFTHQVFFSHPPSPTRPPPSYTTGCDTIINLQTRQRLYVIAKPRVKDNKKQLNFGSVQGSRGTCSRPWTQ
eukprot:247664-Prymnesium_polylepis.1